MAYSDGIVSDYRELVKKADQMMRDPNESEAYWTGIKRASEIFVKRHAWHKLTSAEKKSIDSKLFEEERLKRNATAKARRDDLKSKVAHLSHHYTFNGAPPQKAEDWMTSGSTTECSLYIPADEYSTTDEVLDRIAKNRIVRNMEEVTCHECLTIASDKKIPGAFERQQKLWRKEERKRNR